MEITKVLLVDDDPISLRFHSKFLKELDIEILTAPSGKDGLEILSHNQVSVIILDVNMPEMDGYETAAQIKLNNETSAIPIIFLSADRKENIFKGKGYEIGAVDYIEKPAEPQLFRRKVSALINLNKKQREGQAEQNKLKISLRQSDSIINLLIESMPNPAFIVDSNGLLLHCNKPFALTLEKDKNELINSPVSDILKPDQRDSFRASLTSTLEKGSASSLSIILLATGDKEIEASLSGKASEGSVLFQLL
ncbi:MAG: response regulator [Fibrobacteria bacterium]|nr:response regulator [Fibrobacteria bacterium]